MRKSHTLTRNIACAVIAALCSFVFGQSGFSTNSFHVKVKMNDDRTATVDETIELKGDQAKAEGVPNLVIAESGAGRPSEYTVLKQELTMGQNTIPLVVKPTERGNLVAVVPAGALATGSAFQMHISYRVKGGFIDKSGGDLGRRATFTWNVIPASWPTDIAASSVEVEDAAGIAPLYVGAKTDLAGVRAVVERRGEENFTGSTSRLRSDIVSTGVIISPSEAISAGSGFQIIVALPRDSLKQPPATMPQVEAQAVQANVKPTQSVPPKGTPAKHGAKPSPKGKEDLTLLLLPLLPPLLFLLLYFRRFSWMPLRGYPTSAIPEGITPAEAGYLVDGALTGQHLLGTLAQLADHGFIKLPIGGPMQVSPTAQNSCGAFEKRLLNSLTQNSAPADMTDLKKRLSIRTNDLEPKLVQSLSKQGVLSGGMKRSQLWAAVSLILAEALTDYYGIVSGNYVAAGIAAAGMLACLTLISFLRPITRKGLGTARRVAGLRRFIMANETEFYRNQAGT